MLPAGVRLPLHCIRCPNYQYWYCRCPDLCDLKAWLDSYQQCPSSGAASDNKPYIEQPQWSFQKRRELATLKTMMCGTLQTEYSVSIQIEVTGAECAGRSSTVLLEVCQHQSEKRLVKKLTAWVLKVRS
jgi:hypothetical protein